ncbi:MAG: 6-phosphogluconolactonase [Acidobacteriota bacterium]
MKSPALEFAGYRTDFSTQDGGGMIEERIFSDREKLAEALASSVADSLISGLEARERASLVVSGGSTPGPFFARLRTLELAWERVTITLADERWVDPSSDASNERLVRETLLQDRAATAGFVPLKTPDSTPEEAGQEVVGRLAPHLPFEVVVLGMGGDGHTASLFPCDRRQNAAIWDGEESGTLVVPGYPETAPHPRLSLTPRALLDCRRLILHITGDAKREVYRRAQRPGPVQELPIRCVLHQEQRDVEVYWAP